MAKAWIRGHVYGSDASALYVRGGVIEKTGSDEEILAMTEAADEVTDLHGAYIYPGFVSAHISLLEAGRDAMRIRLNGISDGKEVLRKLTASSQSGSWQTGHGLEKELVSESFRELLDEVSVPCVLYIDDDTCAVNAAALKRADISGDTVIPGGRIDIRTGLLEKEAVRVLEAFLPKMRPQEMEEALIKSARAMNAHGFTACGSADFLHGSSWGDILDVLLKLGRKGLLTLRIDEQCVFEQPEELAHFLDEGYTSEIGEGLFRIGSLLADGSRENTEEMIRLADSYNMPAVLKTEHAGELTELLKEIAVGNNFLGYAVISEHEELLKQMNGDGFPAASGRIAGPEYALCADGIRENAPQIIARYVSEGFTAKEAIRSLTVSGAHFLRFQNETGILKQGMKADFCITDRPLDSDPETIASASILMTVCGGETVFEK